MKKQIKPLTKAEVRMARRLYESGLTIEETAAEMHRARAAVAVAIPQKMRRLPANTREKLYWEPTPEDIAAATAELRRGWSPNEHRARALGITSRGEHDVPRVEILEFSFSQHRNGAAM